MLTMVMAAALLTAQDSGDKEKRVISVSGEATVRAAPDEVHVTLGIEAFDPDVEKAAAKAAEKVTRVRAIAKEQGVEVKDLATEEMQIEPEYCSEEYCRLAEHSHARHERRTKEFVGFRARMSICVIVRDVAKFEPLLRGVLKGGVPFVHNVEFRNSKLREYRDKARSMAMRAAREKAELLAKELGQKVGRPLSIDEQPEAVYGGGWSRWGRAGSGRDYGWAAQNVVSFAPLEAPAEDGASIALGQIGIRARVSVRFELKD